jgi:RNA polymerase sigma factor (sigma-70 family)
MDAITFKLMTENRNREIEKTVLREKPRLFNFIRRSVKDFEEASDILQDVFYQFVAGYDGIRSVEQTTSWLYTVAKNKIIDRFRKKKPMAMSELKTGNSGGDSDDKLTIEDILPNLNSLPDDESFYNMMWEELDDALDELPEKQREVFVMHEFDGMSFNEISETTGEPVNTLLSRKRYAVIYLRERLAKLFKEL